MSRFKEWTSAESGLGSYASKYIELDYRGSGRPNKYYAIELSKLINDFSKVNKLKGSYTTRVLQISNEMYNLWQKFIASKSEK